MEKAEIEDEVHFAEAEGFAADGVGLCLPVGPSSDAGTSHIT